MQGLVALFEDTFEASHDPMRPMTPSPRGTAVLKYRISITDPGTYLATPMTCDFEQERPTSPVVPITMTVTDHDNQTLMTAEVQTPLSNLEAHIDPQSKESSQSVFYNAEQDVSTAQRYGLASGQSFDDFIRTCTQLPSEKSYHLLCDQSVAVYVMDNGLEFDLIPVSNPSGQLMTINERTLNLAATRLSKASRSICSVDLESLALNLTFRGDSTEEACVFECVVYVVFALKTS